MYAEMVKLTEMSKLIRISQRVAAWGCLMLMLCCCGGKERNVTVWNAPESWYSSEQAYDSAKVDVFYIVSTEVLSAEDSTGTELWQSQLIAADRAAMAGEMAWVEENMFYDDYNVIAPYYHQFTFDALQIPDAMFDSVYLHVAEEVCDAFDYYMEHVNDGRPFVLAGFSQGAMLTLDVLRHMTDEQFERMIACYTIGYRLSEADLTHPHIQAAIGETDRGVVISFNSTMSSEAIWPVVADGAAVCINPINWRTDTTSATFCFEGTQNRIRVGEKEKVLIVTTDSPEYYHAFYDHASFFLEAGVSRDNLHHWDLLFYAERIHDNALKRGERE